MIKLNQKYKVVPNFDNPIQGNIRTTEGIRFVQGYFPSPIWGVFEVDTGLKLGRGGICFDVEASAHKNDPFSIDFLFHIEIPTLVDGATPGCFTVTVRDVQTFAMVRFFKEVVVIPRLNNNEVSLEYVHDIWKGSYIPKAHALYLSGKVENFSPERQQRFRNVVS